MSSTTHQRPQYVVSWNELGMKNQTWQHRGFAIGLIAVMMLSASLVTYFVTKASSSSSSSSTVSQEGAASFGGPSFLAAMSESETTVPTVMETTSLPTVMDSFELFVANAVEVDENDAWLFNNYVTAFQKTYDTDDEMLYRRAVWMFNNQNAQIQDAASKQAQFGWTKFSDWTTEEFSQLNGFVMTEDDLKASKGIPQISGEPIKVSGGRRRSNIVPSDDCVDTTDGATDTYGDGCEWYENYQAWCGFFDDSDFSADDMCCTCGGGDDSGSDATTESPSGECTDSMGDATDVYGDDCSWYEDYASWCGYFDDSDFSADDMCCACGGGEYGTPAPTPQGYVAPTPAPVTAPTPPPISGMNINWAELGYTTGVKDQGSCGSCWAFAATEVLEAAMAISGTENAGTELSEQEMVSCSGSGCNGGWPMTAWSWVKGDTDGQCSATTFPYTGTDSSCSVDPESDGLSDAVPASIFKSGSWCTSGLCTDQYEQEETMANDLINYGPMNVNIHSASAWSNYQGGIMDADDCGGDDASNASNVDHAVILVGLNSDADTPYWIVQNSWGTNWGEDGFIYLTYGENTCGIANWAGLVIV